MGKEIGIDLGTTNSVVTYRNKKGYLRQLNYEGKKVIPSVLYFFSRDEYQIGEKAKSLWDNKHNQAGVADFKSHLGENSSNPYDIVAEDGTEFRLRPADVAKYFLNKLVLGMENRLIKEFGAQDGVIDKAVITVPAKFNSKERELTKKAAMKAGLRMVRLAPEPTAAAIAYEEDTGEKIKDEAILVYDFGGGTFDVSIIRKENGAFQEIATNGDKKLGGNLLTERVMQDILERIEDEYGLELPMEEEDFDEECGISDVDYQKNMQSIRQNANIIKEDLSDEEETARDIPLILPDNPNAVFTIEMSREELEELLHADIQRSVDITIRTIEEAKQRGLERLDKIVLAGGSSSIPLVRKLLEERLQDQDIYGDSGEGIAFMISRGAAILAGRLNMLDTMTQAITNSQFGIKVTDGVVFNKFEMLIPENEPLPCVRQKNFQLMEDGQRSLSIEYYDYDVKNYPGQTRVYEDGFTYIDKLMIEDLPAGLKKNEVVIAVTFTAQKDGSLEVAASLQDKNGKEIAGKKITVRRESDGDLQ